MIVDMYDTIVGVLKDTNQIDIWFCLRKIRSWDLKIQVIGKPLYMSPRRSWMPTLRGYTPHNLEWTHDQWAAFGGRQTHSHLFLNAQ